MEPELLQLRQEVLRMRDETGWLHEELGRRETQNKRGLSKACEDGCVA